MTPAKVTQAKTLNTNGEQAFKKNEMKNQLANFPPPFHPFFDVFMILLLLKREDRGEDAYLRNSIMTGVNQQLFPTNI